MRLLFGGVSVKGGSEHPGNGHLDVDSLFPQQFLGSSAQVEY